jgi:hypothetical protein
MSTDLIRYDLLVQEALKGVVRRVLTDAARDGLPGEHHFYVSFRTDHPGARLSPRLREKYPQDMTIVLQHQYDALTITDQGFEVGLSFSGIPERLRVPFDALTGFFDPSVQFGLKFETSEAVTDEPAEPPAEPIPLPSKKSALPALKGPDGKGPRKIGGDADGKPAPKRPAAVKDAEPAQPGPQPGAEVVSLDSFRKKS